MIRQNRVRKLTNLEIKKIKPGFILQKGVKRLPTDNLLQDTHPR